MNFSLLKPDFAKYFASETKYSIAITANDSITKKFPVLEGTPWSPFLLVHSVYLKNFDAANKQVYKCSTPPQWRCHD